MQNQLFNRDKHLYKNESFTELIKDAVRFFNGTPIQTLPIENNFFGSGVYALYYVGNHRLYQRYAELNRLSYHFPIYVGKAVPKGWRQARLSDGILNQSRELMNRLREHTASIHCINDLSIHDFLCRFVIFEPETSDMIGSIEAALIKLNKPLWNTCLDGFGNHDPGSGRYEQAKSDWDVIHTGRIWADKCKGVHSDIQSIELKIQSHLSQLDYQ